MTYQLTRFLGASNSSFVWFRYSGRALPGKWRVIGHGAFTQSSDAVVDDFGDLVPVP